MSDPATYAQEMAELYPPYSDVKTRCQVVRCLECGKDTFVPSVARVYWFTPHCESPPGFFEPLTYHTAVAQRFRYAMQYPWQREPEMLDIWLPMPARTY